MTEITKIAAIAMIGAVLAMLLKRDSPGVSVLIGILTAVLVLIYAVPFLSESLSFAVRLYHAADGTDDAFQTLIRVTGISILSHITSEVAQDAGQKAVASAVALTGRVLCMCLCLPQMEAVLRLFVSLLPTA